VPATGVVITDVRASIKAAFSAQIEANQISKWAYPDHIEFVDVIAKTSVGKIDKKRLRFEFSDKLA
jgi:fatty-acyl-CoA synthase